mmetsp:Transcript_5859/g.11634  ORF Transcript_5859/g.11634 Transcript_5859/m.11634 type:complete len:115 (+) Transcript_5859:512-856(+)
MQGTKTTLQTPEQTPLLLFFSLWYPEWSLLPFPPSLRSFKQRQMNHRQHTSGKDEEEILPFLPVSLPPSPFPAPPVIDSFSHPTRHPSSSRASWSGRKPEYLTVPLLSADDRGL